MGKRVINEEGGSGTEGQRRRRQTRVRKSNRAENPLGHRHSSVSVSPWQVKTGGYTNMVIEREGRRLGLRKRIHREVRAHSTRHALKLGVCHQSRYNVISAPNLSLLSNAQKRLLNANESTENNSNSDMITHPTLAMPDKTKREGDLKSQQRRTRRAAIAGGAFDGRLIDGEGTAAAD